MVNHIKINIVEDVKPWSRLNLYMKGRRNDTRILKEQFKYMG